MNGRLKSFLKKLIPFKTRRVLKRYKRKVSNWIKKRNIEKTTLKDIEDILRFDLKISKGDSLIISSSFGNLNADFSPKELIKLLQTIVSNEGNIVMPFYPPGNSYEWAERGEVFDMQSTKSSMGVLTQEFSEMPEVFKSKHPTKAVVAWGKDAKEIVSGHEFSKTPFYWDSPYGWLLKHPSKSIGLGLKNIPIFHALEDIILEESISIYQDERKELMLKNSKGELETFSTYVHDPSKIAKLKDAGDYVKELKLKTYIRVKFGYTFCYLVDNSELLDKCVYEFKHDNFRFK